jgi:hypothetical protein
MHDKPVAVEMVSEDECLFLVIDGRQVMMRDEEGNWRAAEPGWTVQQVKLWGPDQTWDGIQFSFWDAPLDQVFYVDAEGNPHAVLVTEGGPIPRA